MHLSFMSKILLYVWLFVQFDISKMLWSSSMVEEKKQLWIRVWLYMIEYIYHVYRKTCWKCRGKITQTHIASVITSTQCPWSFADHQNQNWSQTLPWLCMRSLTRVRSGLSVELTLSFINFWLFLADTLLHHITGQGI